ncbi:hypothetical protein [Moorena producens]|uniref:hypothetical protein n=1 Tax=Moorena producens TaxID=1155739 RepID=UPI001314AA78|nr:hypothetical protein [Moorena producens]
MIHYTPDSRFPIPCSQIRCSLFPTPVLPPNPTRHQYHCPHTLNPGVVQSIQLQ